MTIYFGVGRHSLLWKVLDYDVVRGTKVIWHLRLQLGKRSREWELDLDDSRGLSNVSVTYYLERNGKRTGWQLQGPVRRVC